jgi:hypothetical protein
MTEDLIGSRRGHKSNEKILVPYKYIPSELQDDIVNVVKGYSVNFMRIADHSESRVYIGSGSFVKINNRKAILTAGHVCKEITKSKKIMLSIRADSHEFSIETQLLEKVIDFDESQIGKGPDLAILYIPDHDVYRIEAYSNKRFLDLSDCLNDIDPDSYDHIKSHFAFVGAAAEHNETGSQGLVLHAYAYFCRGELYFMRDGYDYVQINIDRTKYPSVPKSFGGISGSGLWEFPLFRNTNGQIVWDGKSKLVGVAFAEISTKEGFAYKILCHGIKSIYRRLFELVGKGN